MESGRARNGGCGESGIDICNGPGTGESSVHGGASSHEANARSQVKTFDEDVFTVGPVGDDEISSCILKRVRAGLPKRGVISVRARDEYDVVANAALQSV